MPTQLEKTAAFLKKMAGEGSIWDKSLLGGADAPFRQPAPAVTQQDLRDANNARAKTLSTAEGQLNDPQLEASRGVDAVLTQAEQGTPLTQPTIDRLNSNYGPGTGKPLVEPKAAPGNVDNYLAAMKRGHLGAVAGTAAAGATALLAGVLTYNMMKKKKGGKITQMPGQRKAAADENPGMVGQGRQTPLTRPADRTQKLRSIAQRGARKAGLVGGLAGLVTGGGAAALAAGGDSASPLDASGGKTWAGKNLGVSTGNDIGDAAVGAGVASLGALGVYQLYKKLRGE